MRGASVSCFRVEGELRCHASLRDVADMSGGESAEFADVEEAIDWARARTALVLVYADAGEPYAAGEVHELAAPDGTVVAWPAWPPADDGWRARVPEGVVIRGAGRLRRPS